jgi:hypothetical protein
MTQPPDGQDPPSPVVVRPGRRPGHLVTLVVLAVVLLLCGGGGVSAYLLLRDAGGPGAADATTAVTGFLEAVYVQRDAGRAAQLTCPDARDRDAVARKIDQIGHSVREYPSPRFSWDEPKVEDEESDRAVVSVRITLTTGDDRTAEQRLRLTVVRDAGWWVCEVEPE